MPSPPAPPTPTENPMYYATLGHTIRSDISLYTDVAMAHTAANRRKGHAVILGEGYAIVTSLRAAEYLAKAGYQYA